MIKYNWLKVMKNSEGKPRKILDLMEFITERPFPKDNYDVETKVLSKIDWSGDSFILNPEPIFQHRNVFTDKELAEYVALASFRSLAEYKVTKRKTLRTLESPVDIEPLNDNRLLTIINNEIYFKWEETTH